VPIDIQLWRANQRKVRFGGTPQPIRETRALPRRMLVASWMTLIDENNLLMAVARSTVAGSTQQQKQRRK
jgi:hypothetical protein